MDVPSGSFCVTALLVFSDFVVDRLDDLIRGEAVHRAGVIQGFGAGDRAAQAVHADGQQDLHRFGVLGNDFADQRFAGYVLFSHRKNPPFMNCEHIIHYPDRKNKDGRPSFFPKIKLAPLRVGPKGDIMDATGM